MNPEYKAARIRFENHKGILYAWVSGEKDSIEVSLDYWRRVVDECLMRKCSRLLVEENFPNQLSTIEIHKLMTAVAKILPRSIRVAFIDQMADHNDLNLFAETVAVNRGAIGRVFASVSEATEWLESLQST